MAGDRVRSAEIRGGFVSAYEAIRAELDGLGMVDSSDGQIVLVLAAALDDRAGVQNIAATAKQLQAGLDAIRDRAPGAADSVDGAAESVAEKLRLVR